MSLFNSISPLIRICRYTGLAPFLMDQNTLKSSPVLRYLSKIVIVFIVLLMFFVVAFNKTFINHEKPKINIVLLNIFMFLNHLHALVAVFEYCRKHDKQIELLNEFKNMDIFAKKKLDMHIDYGKLRIVCRRFIYVWICQVSGFIITVSLINIQTLDSYTIYYALIFLPSCVVRKLSYAYSMMWVTLIHENITLLAKYLKSVSKLNGYYICETFSNRRYFGQKSGNSKQNERNFDISTLLLIKQSYSEIWESSAEIQNIMYFSLPIGLTDDLFVLIFHCFWFFLCLLLGKSEITMYLFPLTNITSNLSNIFFLAYNCNKAAESVSNIQLFFQNLSFSKKEFRTKNSKNLILIIKQNLFNLR